MNIHINKIKYSYDNDFAMEIDVKIPQNKWTIIVGKNGSGKSTLLKLMTGVLTPEFGEINIDHSKIGYIFQNPDDQIIQLSIEKELAFNLENRGVPIREIELKIQESLIEYDFVGREKQSPNELSGGERQRLALAGTLISDPEILIFDEPTGFMDFLQKEKLYKRIEKLKESGKTVIWVTHELDELFLADNVLELDDGKISFFGNQHDYLQKLVSEPFIREHYLECI